MAALAPLSASGSPRDLGRAMGRFGAQAVRERLRPTRFWAATAAQATSPAVTEMARLTQTCLPAIWEEIAGLAEGLDLPLAEVFAWNCRGDLLASAPDGCTTILIPGPPHTIAHNEDGLPFLAPHCGLLAARPDNAPSFASFLYPGSIPGHTFALNATGLAITVNNVRARATNPGLPRMVLGRALLSCTTLDAATALLASQPRAGGFHYTLAQAGDPRLLSVEATAARVSVRAIAAPTAHANHLTHDPREPQIVTASSADRQARATAILAGSPLTILADTGGPGLPILRLAKDDPDDENTIATALFQIGQAAAAEIFAPGAATPFARLDADPQSGQMDVTHLSPAS